MLDKHLGNLKVPAKEIEDFYNKNLANFKTQAKIHARHILVKTEDEAKKILEELKKDVKQFGKIAKEKSSCPSGKQAGGDLGLFDPASMAPAFGNACKEAPIGKLVGPVKTSFGYHIILVDDKTKDGHKKLEEVSDTIKGQLLAEKQRDAYKTLIKGLMKDYKVKIYKAKL